MHPTSSGMTADLVRIVSPADSEPRFGGSETGTYQSRCTDTPLDSVSERRAYECDRGFHKRFTQRQMTPRVGYGSRDV